MSVSPLSITNKSQLALNCICQTNVWKTTQWKLRHLPSLAFYSKVHLLKEKPKIIRDIHQLPELPVFIIWLLNFRTEFYSNNFKFVQILKKNWGMHISPYIWEEMVNFSQIQLDISLVTSSAEESTFPTVHTVSVALTTFLHDHKPRFSSSWLETMSWSEAQDDPEFVTCLLSGSLVQGCRDIPVHLTLPSVTFAPFSLSRTPLPLSLYTMALTLLPHSQRLALVIHSFGSLLSLSRCYFFS